MNKRQEQGAESRRKILDAAERLFALSGYAGMSTSQLSRDSGLPVASLYWHFGSKIGILAAVLDRRAEAVFDEIAHSDSHDDSPFEALDEHIERAVAAVDKYPDFFRLVASLSVDSNPEIEQIRPTLQGIHDRTITTWYDWFVPIFRPKTRAERTATRDLAELARAMYLGGVLLTPTQGHAPFKRAIRAYVALLHADFSSRDR
jgi:AcrR family transcriptional regulator